MSASYVTLSLPVLGYRFRSPVSRVCSLFAVAAVLVLRPCSSLVIQCINPPIPHSNYHHPSRFSCAPARCIARSLSSSFPPSHDRRRSFFAFAFPFTFIQLPRLYFSSRFHLCICPSHISPSLRLRLSASLRLYSRITHMLSLLALRPQHTRHLSPSPFSVASPSRFLHAPFDMTIAGFCVVCV
ncbi:hypothetical protein C8Q73DRAFT_30697 [Cubamyces lactineus]|nr:hypothetical protein C8Q73DRAFT_30697 [Cubamyces lactineus]